MLTPRTTLARRVTAALDASPSRIPVLLGGCGSGRTTLLRQLRDRIGRTSVQHIDVLAASGNRFVLTSRYVARALRLLRDRTSRFEVIDMPALSIEDTLDILGPLTAAAGPPSDAPQDPQEADYLARTVNALADGR